MHGGDSSKIFEDFFVKNGPMGLNFLLKPLLAQWSCILSALNLVNQAYELDNLKGLNDSDNPLDPVKNVHDRLRKFINAHSGINQDSPQDYLTLFAFVRNPPYEMLGKVEQIMTFAFQNPKILRYSDQFGLNQGVETSIMSTVQVRVFFFFA